MSKAHAGGRLRFIPCGFEICEVSKARIKANAFYVLVLCGYVTL
jgi:hypothetical protein